MPLGLLGEAGTQLVRQPRGVFEVVRFTYQAQRFDGRGHRHGREPVGPVTKMFVAASRALSEPSTAAIA